MALSAILTFWAVAVVLIVTPGADWAFTLSAGARGRSVIPAVGGLVIGYAMVTAVVAAGVGALVAGSPAVLTGLTLAGGAYLMWHGATTFARPSTSDTAAPVRHMFLRGIVVSGLNPKGLMVFLALLPQFADPGRSWPIAGQIGVLGLTFTLTCAVFYLCLGFIARTVMHGRPRLARTLGRVSGASMVVIGAGLVVERLLP